MASTNSANALRPRNAYPISDEGEWLSFAGVCNCGMVSSGSEDVVVLAASVSELPPDAEDAAGAFNSCPSPAVSAGGRTLGASEHFCKLIARDAHVVRRTSGRLRL